VSEKTSSIKPVSEKNLDGYGNAPLAWETVLERLEQEWKAHDPFHTHWLATTRPDGRPHVMPVGAAWSDGHFYFTSGPGTRKSKNLARNPKCVITVAGTGMDIVVEGEAKKVTDEAKLKRLAELYASSGWAPTVRDGAFYHDYSAPSAGPPPWEVYEFTPETVFGLGHEGATRWRF
jgi:nitroimidazol reductase NimA-like FMN-containing flavoprotein (pyridoxamine 5'-phosphate oxidase superfamily)